MNFPKHIRTKTEANQLACEIFPDYRDALAFVHRARPGDEYPFFWVEQQARDDLRALFEWLSDQQTRIYKRPRWHLFYDLAQRLVRLLADNHSAADHFWRMQIAQHEFNQRQLAATMSGDGDGI